VGRIESRYEPKNALAIKLYTKYSSKWLLSALFFILTNEIRLRGEVDKANVGLTDASRRVPTPFLSIWINLKVNKKREMKILAIHLPANRITIT